MSSQAPYSYKQQVKIIFLIELAFLVTGAVFAFSFWNKVCDASLIHCLKEQQFSLTTFLGLAIIRPFVFTPILLFALMLGKAYGSLGGALLNACGGILSTMVVFFLGKIIGKKFVHPWLKSNLPQTSKFFRSQDWKIVLATRLIPFLPFDFLSLTYGLMNFHLWRVLLFSFLGVLPESYIFSEIANPNTTLTSSTIISITIGCCFFLIPGMILEFVQRRQGSSLWYRLKSMWKEIHQEVYSNNAILTRKTHDPEKIPVLLLYGFFSSRRTLTTLERILTNRGYEVINFNLGGLFGVFFTRGIIETANFINRKIHHQFSRYKYDKIIIIAHSKGGLVALWWLLKLNGQKHCKTLITLGTPFKGSLVTWVGLLTPLGFVLQDLWQMRPGSMFLKTLKQATIPENLKIYNFYSNKDKVAKEEDAIFTPFTQNNAHITKLPMHHVTHFQYLNRKDVGDAITRILKSPYLKDHL